MSRKNPTALVLASQVGLARVRRRHRWHTIGYTLAVEFRKKSTLGDPVISAEKVIGRAIGLRDDGQQFFATIDLPWIWEKNFEWQPHVKLRLDTFLFDFCKCSARDGDVITCEHHERLTADWHTEDLKRVPRAEQKQMLDQIGLPGRTPGVIDPLRLMHRDYPWCRYDTLRFKYVCILCDATCEANGNMEMYRNQFIRRHSKCGFGEIPSPIPKSFEDKVIERVYEEITKQFNNSGGRLPADQVVANIRDLRGTIVIEPEGARSSDGSEHKFPKLEAAGSIPAAPTIP